MKTRTRSNLLLLAVLLLTAVLMFSPFLFGKINQMKVNYPDLTNGQADYSASHPSSSASIYLLGEWTCYDGHIISNNADTANSYTVNIPAHIISFSNISENNGRSLSYKATISNLNFSNATVYIPNFAGIYTVFVNGEIISQSGNMSDSGPNATMELISFPYDFSGNNTYEIVIEVSCEMMSGLYMTPIISDYDKAQNYDEIAQALRTVIFAIVIFSGFFILVYSLKNSNLFASKWLPLLCFLVAIRLMISTEGYSAFRFCFPSIDYESMTLLICMSTFIIKLVALLFYSETLDINISKGTFISFCIVSLACTVITSFFPFVFFNPYYYIIIQAVALPFDIILLNNLTKSIIRKVPYAKFYTLGYVALISGIMVDCFYTNGLIPFISSLVLPVSFFLFIITFLSIFFDKITVIYRASLKAAELDRELTAANTAVMISQIQPHFLYNALNTIKYLIKRDPKAAESAVISFSKYLRGNMDSITQKTPIPFSEELEHTKNYCNIEILRFGDKINIIYNTEFTDFLVPSLTIQPLVENAIKHGVTKKAEGGTVTVSTFNHNSYVSVVIEDDGVGFDPKSPDYTPNDNHAHVGIQNVKNRLKMMVNADIQIESQIGIGTKVTIKIPKGENV